MEEKLNLKPLITYFTLGGKKGRERWKRGRVDNDSELLGEKKEKKVREGGKQILCYLP